MQERTAIQEEQLLSLRDLSQYLSCSRTYARKLIDDGTISSFKIGSLRRVRKVDVDHFVEERLAAEKRYRQRNPAVCDDEHVSGPQDV